jgi:hypothetical protein
MHPMLKLNAKICSSMLNAALVGMTLFANPVKPDKGNYSTTVNFFSNQDCLNMLDDLSEEQAFANDNYTFERIGMIQGKCVSGQLSEAGKLMSKLELER